MIEKSNLTVKKVILDKWEAKTGYMFDYKDLHELECIINQFENHITYLNDKNQQLKKQLEYIRSGEYYNQLRFERDMLQDIVDKMKVSKEDRNFIDMTHRNTELSQENQQLKADISFCLKSIKQEMEISTDSRTRQDMLSCYQILNEWSDK